MQLSLNFKQVVLLSVLVFFIFIILYFYLANIYEGVENKDGDVDSLDKESVIKLQSNVNDMKRTLTNIDNILFKNKKTSSEDNQDITIDKIDTKS
jgi:hypothetical protein